MKSSLNTVLPLKMIFNFSSFDVKTGLVFSIYRHLSYVIGYEN